MTWFCLRTNKSNRFWSTTTPPWASNETRESQRRLCFTQTRAWWTRLPLSSAPEARGKAHWRSRTDISNNLTSRCKDWSEKMNRLSQEQRPRLSTKDPILRWAPSTAAGTCLHPSTGNTVTSVAKTSRLITRPTFQLSTKFFKSTLSHPKFQWNFQAKLSKQTCN